ncbi:MAG: hypothetical protein P4L53_27280 [Candidatus Obscuribacterales bacterium]|nr:hypothetical protein [Candidatus Obscuribacterales bacterium]
MVFADISPQENPTTTPSDANLPSEASGADGFLGEKSHSLRISATLISSLIFCALFAFVPHIAKHKDVADFLERKNAIATLYPRVEKFLVSSADPAIVLMSSSTGFLPCWTTDIAAKAVHEPKDLIAVYKWTQIYELPSFLLMTLANNGVTGVSATHLGVPTANITDNLMILDKLFAAGKHPRLVIFNMNGREIAYVPAPGFENGGSYIENFLQDLHFFNASMPQPRFVRAICTYARWSVFVRTWESQRFFFASSVRRLVRHTGFLKKIVSASDLLARTGGPAVANGFQIANFVTPVSFIQDSSFYTYLFKNRRQSFVDRQFNALSGAAKLCREHGTKLLCVEVPWYPDVDMTPEFKQEYKSKIADVCKRYGAEYYEPAADVAFDYGEFLEPVHMNALGGEKYFWLTGKFIAKHKEALLP